MIRNPYTKSASSSLKKKIIIKKNAEKKIENGAFIRSTKMLEETR